MSSTPPTLANFLRLFATNANHPSGPHVWSGQPTKVEPPGTSGGFVPNQGAAAEYFNALFHGLAQHAIGVEDWAKELGIVDIQEFTESDTYTTRDRAFAALVIGCGGGGGGGGGGNGTTSNDLWYPGGGGGGGALLSTQLVTLAPSSNYDITIGAGGTGGTATNDGNPGGSTTLSLGGTPLATFPGGQGGFAPWGTRVPGLWVIYAPGGQPRHLGQWLTMGNGDNCPRLDTSMNISFEIAIPPAGGGWGMGGGFGGFVGGIPGSRNPVGDAAGGAGSTQGTDSGSARGGGGGGGGGAGPFGSGGAGGNGANGSTGSTFAASSGTGAPTNSGGGGGGGGTAGRGLTAGPGASGGTGGSGRLYLVVFERAVTP
jgi:hypothetical protein